MAGTLAIPDAFNRGLLKLARPSDLSNNGFVRQTLCDVAALESLSVLNPKD
jgi:hypothetical protein